MIPDAVVAALRAREVGGLIELPKPPKFHRGEHVKIRQGPFVDRVGLVIGLRPHERVAVLLKLLGGSRQVELPETAAEPWPGPDPVQMSGHRKAQRPLRTS
jgi:transcription antitermination factor NusG